MLELKDIAELYELWCYFEVEAAVSALLGPPAEASAPALDELGAKLPWSFRVAWPNAGVELFYNLSFSRSAKAANRSYSVLLRPDIVLRIAEGRSAGDHLFDAKFKVQALGDVVPTDPEAVEDEQPERRGVFKRGDLYKMHTYRDALPRARTVWILYPGTELQFFDEADGVIRDAGRVRGDAAGVGAVPLRPGDRKALVEVVQRLLFANGTE